mgnify:FL=1
MPNKNKRGRPQKKHIKKSVADLRGLDLSFSEIGKELQISRQLAWYHSKNLSTAKGIAKENKKV